MRVASIVLGGVLIGSACNSSGVTSPSPRISTALAGPGAEFALGGTVHDTLGRPIADARVEVLSGEKRGLTVLSDERGRYTFEAVHAAQFRASKPGYRDHVMWIGAAGAARFFRLDSANGSARFQGRYTLAFTADSSCSAIPGYARRRTYDATADGFLMTLSGGGYGLSSAGYFNNVLYTGVFEQTANIYMSDPPIFEKFPQGSYLVIFGEANGSLAESPAAFTLNGWFTYCSEAAPGGEPKCAVPEVSCRSSNHRLTVAATP